MNSVAETAPTWRLSPARAVWQVVVGWSFIALFAVVASAISILTLGRASNWLTPKLLHFWSHTMLWIMGVKLEVEGAEHLSKRGMRVATFNHTSLIDAIIIPTLYPIGGVAAIKREVLYMPFVGLAVWSLGFLLIDRGRSEKSRRVLQRAAERMGREKLTVFIAPEGSRSKTDDLLEFKKGAFHLAVTTGAPIVPIVIVGANEVYPMNRLVAQPGTIRMRILPPIDTSGVTLETMGEFASSLRATYQREISEMRAGR